MSTNRLMTAVASVCLLTPVLSLAADVPATAPVAATAAGQQLSATVTAVKGMVSVRDDDAKPWRMAKVGMVLPVGCECRTGPKSSITLTIDPEQTVTLDRLGTVKVLEAFKTDTKLKTDLGMKYGRVRYSVEAAGLEHESTIRSPSNALAVRGSGVEMFDDGIDSGAIVYKGIGSANNRYGNSVTLGSGSDKTYDDSPIALNTTDLSTAQHNYDNTIPYISRFSLSSGEQLAVSNNNVVSGLQTGFADFRAPNGSFNTGTGQAVSGNAVTGRLTFSLSWTGDNASGAGVPNLDLFVTSPAGEKLFPHNTTFQVASGGSITPDDHSIHGTLGLESATWNPTVPLGKYTYGAHYTGTGDPATFTLSVLLNGTPINPTYDDTLTQYDPDASFTLDLQNAPASQGDARQKLKTQKRLVLTAAPKSPLRMTTPAVPHAATLRQRQQ